MSIVVFFHSQLEYVFLQIDPERAVAAGASWGGYAIKYVQRRLSQSSLNNKFSSSWIQSNPEFGFGFKARNLYS